MSKIEDSEAEFYQYFYNLVILPGILIFTNYEMFWSVTIYICLDVWNAKIAMNFVFPESVKWLQARIQEKKWISSKFPGFPILSNISPIFHNVSSIFH